jgi:hypothetical protein
MFNNYNIPIITHDKIICPKKFSKYIFPIPNTTIVNSIGVLKNEGYNDFNP